MKSYKELEKQYTPAEIAESYIFPGTEDHAEQEAIREAYRKHRKQSIENLSPEKKLRSRLLQLKFIMEDYVGSEDYNSKYYFGYFLKEYIDRLDIKYKDFAADIDINPAELSQIINKHRSPNEKLIIRLEIHFNKNFPAVMWCKVLEKERLYDIQYNHDLRDSEERHVKRRLSVAL